MEWDAIDEEFVDQYTHGFEAWREHVRRSGLGLGHDATGLSREQITEAAQMLADSTGHRLLLGDGV